VSKVIQRRRERPPTVGYGELLRGNRSFRFLWLGQVVSQMGDWFDTIAVYTITLRLTGSSRSVALIMAETSEAFPLAGGRALEAVLVEVVFMVAVVDDITDHMCRGSDREI